MRTIGREAELADLNELLLGPAAGTAALTLAGPAGIGKTVLWTAAADAARRAGLHVLTTRAASEETELDFTGLADLLEELDLQGLPEPMREALDAVLLRGGSGAAVDRRAVNTAVLTVLRRLAERSPVLVAIDDVQWLDAASGAALAFAGRRLAGDQVRFLMSARVEDGRGTAADGGTRSVAGPLELALRPMHVDLRPLDLEATARIIVERHGRVLRRDAIRRVHRTAAGNPLFALELARMLVVSGNPAAAGALPLPERVEELLTARVEGLEDEARTALLAVALSLDPRVAEITAVTGERALERALATGVLTLDRDRVRLAHPLLGEVAGARADIQERRALHMRLATAERDEERRALHLARAAALPDTELARVVAAAAARAARRGAVASSVELGAAALTLTPEDDPERSARLIDVADYHSTAGEFVRAAALLRPLITALPPGPERARAMLLLADTGETETGDSQELIESAIAEAPPDSALRAFALSELAYFLMVGIVEQIERAAQLAGEALQMAREAGDEVVALRARGILTWARALRGLPDSSPDLTAEPEAPGKLVVYSPERAFGVRSMWRGELDSARLLFERCRELADARGEGEGYMASLVQLCELELRVGNWDAASALAASWTREYDEHQDRPSMLARMQASIAVGRGDVGAAIAAADTAIALVEQQRSGQWHRLEALRVRGMAELLAGRPADAVVTLERVWEHLERAGIEDPGAFPVAPELITALALAGQSERAHAMALRLAQVAEAQDHAWARAAAAHALGIVSFQDRDYTEAERHLSEAVARFESLGMPFAQLRSLMSLGMARRRARRLRGAREALEQARAGFTHIGSHGWAALARDELRRVSGRRSTGAALTATELRVASLVAEGRTNKEVAAELFVTARTVEGHLTRIFAKLGVRSRTELARALAERPGVRAPRK